VPVNPNLTVQSNELKALEVFESGFLTLWTSSIIIQENANQDEVNIRASEAWG
jgi:hypothetical protein